MFIPMSHGDVMALDEQPFDFDAAIRRMAELQKLIDENEYLIHDVVNRIKTYKNEFGQIDERIRVEAQRYLTETGEKKPHEAVWITFPDKRQFVSEECTRVIADYPTYAIIDPKRYAEGMTILMQFATDLVIPDMDKISKDFRKGESSPFPFETISPPVVNVSKKLGHYLIEEERDDFKD